MDLDRAWAQAYRRRLYWLRYLLERLGRKQTLLVWQEAFARPDPGLLEPFLASGWKRHTNAAAPPSEETLLGEGFPTSLEGVTRGRARELLANDPTLALPRAHHTELRVRKQATAYIAIHIGHDGLARLTEALSRRLGKEGELVAYDVMRAYRRETASKRPMTVEQLLSQWGATDGPQDVFWAGLETEVIRRSEREVLAHVKACEWARYYHEHHSTVGYLVSCSTDDAELVTCNAGMRMQRTSTLMEGGPVCDFRVYVL